MIKITTKIIFIIPFIFGCFFINLAHIKGDTIKINVTGTGGLTGLGDVSLVTCNNSTCTEYLAIDNYEYTSDKGTVYCLDGHIPGPLNKNVTYSCSPTSGEYADGMSAIMKADNYSYFEKQMALRIYSSGGNDPINEGKDTYGNTIYTYDGDGEEIDLSGKIIPITNAEKLNEDNNVVSKYKGDREVLLENGVKTNDGIWSGHFVNGTSVLSAITSLVSKAVKADDSIQMEFELVAGPGKISGEDILVPVSIKSNAPSGSYRIVSFEITNYETEQTPGGATIVIKGGKKLLSCEGEGVPQASLMIDVSYKISYTSSGDNVYQCDASGYQPMLLNLPSTPIKKTGDQQLEVVLDCKDCKWDEVETPTNCCSYCVEYPNDDICDTGHLENCEEGGGGEDCPQMCDYFVSSKTPAPCETEGFLIGDDAKNLCKEPDEFTTDYEGNPVLACAIDEVNGELKSLFEIESGSKYCEIFCAHAVSYRFPGDGMTVNAGYRFAVGSIGFSPAIGGNERQIATFVNESCRTSKIDYKTFINDYESADASAKVNGQKDLERSKQISASNELGQSGAVCDIKNPKTCIDPSFGYSNGVDVFKISGDTDAKEALDACLGSTIEVCETIGGDPVNSGTCYSCDTYEEQVCGSDAVGDDIVQCAICQNVCNSVPPTTNCDDIEVSSCTLTDCAKYETTIEKGKKVVVPSISYEAYGTTYKTTRIDSCYTDIDFNNFFIIEPQTYSDLYERAIINKGEAIRQISNCLKVQPKEAGVIPDVGFSYDNKDNNGSYYSYSGILDILEDNSGIGSGEETTEQGDEVTGNKILKEGKFPHDYRCDTEKCYDKDGEEDAGNKFSDGPVSEWYGKSNSVGHAYELADNAFPKIEKDSGISGLSDQNSAYSLGIATLPIHYTTQPNIYPYSLTISVPSDLYHIIANINPGIPTTYASGDYTCTYKVEAGLWKGKECLNLIYRTISLSNPFAAFDGNTRKTGSNWCGEKVKTTKEISIIDDQGNDGIGYETIEEGGGCEAKNSTVEAFIHNSRGTKDDEIYTLDPMYTITLTPSIIKEVRSYNKQHDYGSYDGIICTSGINCRSNFIRQTIFDSIGTSCGIAGKQGGYCGKGTTAW